MKRRRTSAGFSIIDAVLAIVLVATAYIALGVVLSGTSFQSVKCETGTTAIMLARDVMAQTRAKDFASISSVGMTYFSSPFSGYRYTVTIAYVDAADLDTPVAGPTNYKKIDVAVSYAGGTNTAHLYDLVADLQ